MARRSKSRAELSPGPGHYQVKNALVFAKYRPTTAIISPTKKNAKRPILETPGPGQYQTFDQFGRDGRKVTISSKLLSKDSRNYQPGPGYYEPSILNKSSSAHAMGKGERLPVVPKEAQLIPGPGSYDSPDKFGYGSHSMTMHARLDDRDRRLSPGPGHYDPLHTYVK